MAGMNKKMVIVTLDEIIKFQEEKGHYRKRHLKTIASVDNCENFYLEVIENVYKSTYLPFVFMLKNPDWHFSMSPNGK